MFTGDIESMNNKRKCDFSESFLYQTWLGHQIITLSVSPTWSLVVTREWTQNQLRGIIWSPKSQISMSIGSHGPKMVAVELDGMLELAGKVLRGLAEWPTGRAEANCGTNSSKSKSAQAQRAPSPASLPLPPPNHPCRKEELKNGETWWKMMEKWWKNDGKCICSQQFECSAKKKAPVFAIQPFSAMTVHKQHRWN